MSAQIAREYLVVCTRPAGTKGLGLSVADAVISVYEPDGVKWDETYRRRRQ